MTLKELPIGSQPVARIIEENLVYADKTAYILKLIKSKGQHFFLSRPRRFGKSLLINTLKELFSGRPELFKGLLIDQEGYDFPKRAVVSLSLSTNSQTSAILERNLMVTLKKIAKAYKVSVPISSSAQYFGDLIVAVSEKTNSQVAVLIDEYDAPVTRNLANEKVAEANAIILHDFFAKLKDDAVLERVAFTLVTGITRFALTSMDSGANHLNDISLAPEYDGICGFTIPEFDALFADRLEETLKSLKNIGKFTKDAKLSDLRNEIFRWYNGYDWGGKNRVLNPFSILHFFNNKRFAKYWIESGLLIHLTALIKARPWDFIDLQLKSYLSETIRKTELNKLQIAPVLFHSGYLTLDRPSESAELNQKTDNQVE
ncbi:MAG: AAA family ATPase, partial [Deltaproteobacteria bacterium]|nr:AAA family ATPase [Deltaproteobacteria bacterium]